MYDDDTEQLPVYRSGGTHGAAQTPTPEPRRARRAGPTSHRRSASTESHRLRYVGRGFMSLFAVGVIGVTGVAWYGTTNFDSGFNTTGVIDKADKQSLGDDINMLLIGLDTRKDLNGNDLPKDILDQLHAGDGSEGGYNANSLILVHIPKDLKKIVAFSIPRDDYVQAVGIPGYDHIKIKEAYGLKKFYAEEKLKAQGVTDKVDLERQGRDAGRASIVQAVKSLTGVPINRFAEVSLVGFYHLADALGGVDVCLNHAVDDSYFSGAVFPAGPQHLDAANALSFVRQRHGLENGDLDRTHRQQAFLTSVAKQLKDSGTITNIGKMKALMDVAHRDVVLSDGWSLTDFITTLGRADSPAVEFRTLPVLRYDNVDGQDVNIIDPAAIKKEVRSAFGVEQPTVAAAPKITPTSTLDVVNATGTSGMAAKVSKTLGGKGFPVGDVSNATYSDGTSTMLYYGTGADTDAQALADMLGGNVTPAASSNVSAGHIKLVLGTDFEIPETLDPAAASSTTAATTTSKTPATTTSDTPNNGKPVTTTIGGSIPCVN